MAMVVC